MDLNDRAKAFETQFMHNNEIEFRSRMKAYRLMVRWVAEDQLSLDTEEAQDFCDQMILVMVRKPDQDAFFQDLQHKLKNANIDVSIDNLHKIYQENLSIAYNELKPTDDE